MVVCHLGRVAATGVEDALDQIRERHPDLPHIAIMEADTQPYNGLIWYEYVVSSSSSLPVRSVD